MNPGNLLEEIGLSKTRNRVQILRTLARASAPLSGREISDQLPVKCDKSTIHRTLNALYEKKVLQRIIIDHEVKYALGGSARGSSGHQNDHIHFKCTACDRLFCLKSIEIQHYTLPEGFTPEEHQFLIIGTCRECQQ